MCKKANKIRQIIFNLKSDNKRAFKTLDMNDDVETITRLKANRDMLDNLIEMIDEIYQEDKIQEETV